MPRRNLYWLAVILVVSLVCFQRADAERRSSMAGMLESFYRAMEYIDQDYVEKVDRQKLFEGAMRGLTGELDEYSTYFPPVAYRDLRESLDGQFGGIGIQVVLDEETKQLVVVSPLVGTPAYEAGILAGDRILKINGESTEGFSLRDAVQRLRGEDGTPVTLTVLHPTKTEPSDIEVRRKVIKVDSVVGDRRDASDQWVYEVEGFPGIGYVRISTFGEHTTDELRAALAWLEARDVQALVIDLRDNGGGLLHTAIDICDMFVDDGVIVSTRGRDAQTKQVYRAHASGTVPKFPVAVIVNRYSASASEILAACLQDHHRAVIVGERSWGKGSVQNVLELGPNADALKLTVATYWRPSNKNIHRLKSATEADDWGVRPDPGLEVTLSKEDVKAIIEHRRARDIVRRGADGQPLPPEKDAALPTAVDPQLRVAVEYLERELAHKSHPPVTATPVPVATAEGSAAESPSPAATPDASPGATPESTADPKGAAGPRAEATGEATGDVKPAAEAKPAGDAPPQVDSRPKAEPVSPP